MASQNPPRRVGRRSFVGKAAAGAAVVWSVPVISSVTTPAAALSNPATSVYHHLGNNPQFAGGADQMFTRFAAATGTALTTGVTLPAIATYDIWIFNFLRTPFSAADLATINAFVSGGGTLISIGDSSAFAAANAVVNQVSTSLGSGMSVGTGSFDGGFHTTLDIAVSPCTVGVSSFRYAWTSDLNVSGPAQLLVTGQSGQGLVGIAPIGSGFHVVASDTNLINDNSNNAYTAHDNGTFWANIACK